MADTFTVKIRSYVMSRVKSSNTSPELTIRRILHKLGYRYRINMTSIAGKPDIVFTKRKKIIFVHGCFWHQHAGCLSSVRPTSNREYWIKKLNRNIQRDIEVKTQLESDGWKILILWECVIKSPEIEPTLIDFLGNPKIH